METHPRKRHGQAGGSQQRQQRAPKVPKKQSYNLLKSLKDNPVIVVLAFLLVAGFVLKYFEDYHHSLERFTDLGDDIYATMGVSRSANEQEIKAMYRQLNHKWHPDKNPDCAECKEKFMKIKAAYKILSNPELRALYDRTNGRTVDIITSTTTELTRENFDTLVRNSGEVWVVQVYADDSPSCHNFAKHWEDAASRMGNYAKFGRINSLMHPKAMKKLPINAQLFPSVIMLFPDGGYDLFPQEALHGYSEFRAHFLDVYPNVTTTCKDHQEFKKLAGNRHAMLFRGNEPERPVPLAVKNVALRYKWAFDTFWVASETPVHSDEQFTDDMTSAGEGSNLLLHIALSQLHPNVVALGIFYAPGASQMLSAAPLVEGAYDELIKSVEAMLMLSHPPMELSVHSFEHLCVNQSSTRDLFCLIAPENAEDKLPLPKVAEKLSKYEHLAHIGSIFSKHQKQAEDAQAPVANADVHPVHLPNNQATQKFREIAESAVTLLDAKRGKFCMIGHKKYDCELEEDENLEWIASLAEGAYDTMTWYDVQSAFGGSFKDAALLPKHHWQRYWPLSSSLQ